MYYRRRTHSSTGSGGFYKGYPYTGLGRQLDTNGYRPKILEELCGHGLLDYIAMDIKAGRSRYEAAAGIHDLSMELIDESIRLLMSGSVPYEFGPLWCGESIRKRISGKSVPGSGDAAVIFFRPSGTPSKFLCPESTLPFQRKI